MVKKYQYILVFLAVLVCYEMILALLECEVEMRDMEEIHYGDEGPHWTVVPMKKKKCLNFDLISTYHFDNKQALKSLKLQASIQARNVMRCSCVLNGTINILM